MMVQQMDTTLPRRIPHALATLCLLSLAFLFIVSHFLSWSTWRLKAQREPTPCQLIASHQFGFNRNIFVVSDVALSHTGRKEPLCNSTQYPSCFILDVNGREMLPEGLALQACQETYLKIHAVRDDGSYVNCKPWVDIYARLVGPDLDNYPKAKRFNLYFNKVKVAYAGNGMFNVRVPPIEGGRYQLEILLVHRGDARKTLLRTTSMSRCLDAPLVNTPVFLMILETGLCEEPEPTPLCTVGDSPGRWVTVPETGCDGGVCEGDINVLSSNRRVWAPYDCHFKIFDSESLMQCISGKTTLLLGDSLTEEMANEILQILYYNSTYGLKEKTDLQADLTWLGKPRITSWREMDNDTKVGFSFVFGNPLGCGLECFTNKNAESLTTAYNNPYKIDFLIVIPGTHDASPRQDPYLNVFDKYKRQLPIFYEKMQHILSGMSKVIWLNIPESSDRARCDFNSKPRVRAMNRLTESFVVRHPDLHYIDYFSMSEGCQCGDLHKGIRYFRREADNSTYNGFLSRMAVHMALTLLCQDSLSPETKKLLAQIFGHMT
ncbi:uncharacterized protein [Ptychodera flava]|uniref:uncharacterized protein n=1 Tax=Ptychodera flava TaxID=63121 RepID=UPI003969F158